MFGFHAYFDSPGKNKGRTHLTTGYWRAGYLDVKFEQSSLSGVNIAPLLFDNRANTANKIQE